MIAFAGLLERLAFTQAADTRCTLLRHYLQTRPDPERGLALALLVGGLTLPGVKPSVLRTLIAERTDPVLFDLSREHVGDLSETIALLWPTVADRAVPTLVEVVEATSEASGAALSGLLAGWLDRSPDPTVRLTLLKLLGGGLKRPVSIATAQAALAAMGEVAIADVAAVWLRQTPPYTPLLAWLDRRAPRPDITDAPIFLPPMSAAPLDDPTALHPPDWRAEWQWDGVRVQLVATATDRRVYARDGEDLTELLPEIVDAMTFQGVLDGMLLAMRDGTPAPFAALAHRLGRPSASTTVRRAQPIGIRLFDLLIDGTEDLRALTFDTRRVRLEAWHARILPAGMDLSPLVPFSSVAALLALRGGIASATIRGLILKRGDSRYTPDDEGAASWLSWRRPPNSLDAVLMYVERERSLTFGVWSGDALLPIGKVALTPALATLDRWARAHTVARFGPVREVEKSLVLTIAFDSAQRSARHKAGVTLRGARIVGVRDDVTAQSADRLETLLSLADQGAPPIA